jgi:hypothetical protein
MARVWMLGPENDSDAVNDDSDATEDSVMDDLTSVESSPISQSAPSPPLPVIVRPIPIRRAPVFMEIGATTTTIIHTSTPMQGDNPENLPMPSPVLTATALTATAAITLQVRDHGPLSPGLSDADLDFQSPIRRRQRRMLTMMRFRLMMRTLRRRVSGTGAFEACAGA